MPLNGMSAVEIAALWLVHAHPSFVFGSTKWGRPGSPFACLGPTQASPCRPFPPAAGPFIVFNEPNELALLRKWFQHMREVRGCSGSSRGARSVYVLFMHCTVCQAEPDLQSVKN